MTWKILCKMTEELWAVDKKTRSYTYIFPMLGNNAKEFNFVVNCFIGDRNKPELENKIFLLLKFSGEKRFEEYEKYIKMYPNYGGNYDPDNTHVMYYFEVPEKYKKEYELFKKGKYSIFSDEYKRKIFKFHNIGSKSDVGKVLYRTEDKFREWERKVGQKIDRNQEIGSIPDTKVEIFQEYMKTNTFKFEELREEGENE